MAHTHDIWIIAPAIRNSRPSIGPGRAFDLEGVRAFFGFTNWPNGIAHLDLGGRTVDVIPTPGHNETHLAFTTTKPGFSFREIF